MTYVVTENCIKCKYMDCVEVCPVDCFYAGENMLVIHPDECIDCGVCAPECPAEAIKPDTEPGLEEWLKLNREFSLKWPNMTVKGAPPLVKTRYGFHIVAVDQSIPGKTLPFEAVRERIAERLRARVEERALRQYVSVLAGQAKIIGVDLNAANTPLVQ